MLLVLLSVCDCDSYKYLTLVTSDYLLTGNAASALSLASIFRNDSSTGLCSSYARRPQSTQYQRRRLFELGYFRRYSSSRSSLECSFDSTAATRDFDEPEPIGCIAGATAALGTSVCFREYSTCKCHSIGIALKCQECYAIERLVVGSQTQVARIGNECSRVAR